MKARTLFIGSLSLSLAIHALILFKTPWSLSKPASRRETYRVELIQKPVKTGGNEEPETTPVSTVIQAKPKPREDPREPRIAATMKYELSDDVKEREQSQVIQGSEETNTADSQLQQEPDQATDSQKEVRTVNSVHRSNSWPAGAPRSSFQIQSDDYQRILDELTRLLHKHLRYPEIARRKGIEGALAITLTLNTNGTATDVNVSESSGSHILDRAAVRVISDIFPYPDPPDTPLHFTIPVTYRLTGSE